MGIEPGSLGREARDSTTRPPRLGGALQSLVSARQPTVPGLETLTWRFWPGDCRFGLEIADSGLEIADSGLERL